MQGWIKLHRELMDKPIWSESSPEQKTILITLLMMASHTEKEWEWKGEKYAIQPGQFITSLPSIVQKSGEGISIQNVRTALARFKKYDFLTDEPTNKNRLITIVNWGFYQESDDEANRQTNRQLTGSQQATNRQLTAIKNVKNDKNEKNVKKKEEKIKHLDSVLLTQKQIDTLVKKYGQDGFNQIVKILNDYKNKSGKQYESDYLAITRWVAKRYLEDLQKAAKGGQIHGKQPPSGYSRDNLIQESAELEW